MTFDDDFLVFRAAEGELIARCLSIGVSWPPPAVLDMEGSPYDNPRFKRLTFSSISDRQRAQDPSVVRGAIYSNVEH